MKKYILLTMALFSVSSSIALAGSQDYGDEEQDQEEYEYNHFTTAVACTSKPSDQGDVYRFTFNIATEDAGQNYINDDQAIYINETRYGMRTGETPRTISKGLIVPAIPSDDPTLKVISGDLQGISDVMSYRFLPHRHSLVNIDYERYVFSGELNVELKGFVPVKCLVEGRLNFAFEKK